MNVTPSNYFRVYEVTYNAVTDMKVEACRGCHEVPLGDEVSKNYGLGPYGYGVGNKDYNQTYYLRTYFDYTYRSIAVNVTGNQVANGEIWPVEGGLDHYERCSSRYVQLNEPLKNENANLASNSGVSGGAIPVSYTHLTLPTICSV